MLGARQANLPTQVSETLTVVFFSWRETKHTGCAFVHQEVKLLFLTSFPNLCSAYPAHVPLVGAPAIIFHNSRPFSRSPSYIFFVGNCHACLQPSKTSTLVSHWFLFECSPVLHTCVDRSCCLTASCCHLASFLIWKLFCPCILCSRLCISLTPRMLLKILFFFDALLYFCRVLLPAFLLFLSSSVCPGLALTT